MKKYKVKAGKGISVRFMALTLAAVMTLSSASAVFADETAADLSAVQESSDISQEDALNAEEQTDYAANEENAASDQTYAEEEEIAAQADDSEDIVPQAEEGIMVMTAAEPAESPYAELTIDNNSGWFRVDAFNIQDAAKVKVAVWSDKNGQDDLYWYDASGTTDGSYVATYNISRHSYEQGKYYFDVYAYDASGKGTFIDSESGEFFTKAESVKAVIDNDAGWFRVDISGVTGVVSKVLVPVWHRADQKDLVWYEASSNGNGSYVISKNTAPQDYQTGTYYFDVYAVGPGGSKTYLGGDSAKFTAGSSLVSLSTVSENIKYSVSVSDVSIPGGVKGVQFAVWSAAGNRKDLKWYTANKSGNTYTSAINIADHKYEGKYYIDAYAVSATGAKVFIAGNYDLNVAMTVSASISMENPSGVSGTFELNVTIEDSNMDISQVQIPTWTKNGGQDDIKYYQAVKQSDGRWKLTVKAADHDYETGTYISHVYVTFENGVKKYACQATYPFNPGNYLYVKKTSTGHRDIVIKNVSSDVSSMYFAVWSIDNGQDDLKWYTASKQSDGSYKASIDLQKFSSAGTFTVHAYKNDKSVFSNAVGVTSFTATKNEIGKNGWYYENGYKFYYISGVKQTDVRSILGSQSAYRIEVNRTCCTITIYAKDGSNGYIIPVCAFACSVGLPATPTRTGNYSVGAKYRWKTLMGPSYGQYVSAVSGQSGVYFHSVAGTNMTSYNLSAAEYNKLGSPASHGCIRLNVRDAKWIYDNVPTGSSIRIYDSSNPGPMGKPATIKIPGSQNWDPTDPAIAG